MSLLDGYTEENNNNTNTARKSLLDGYTEENSTSKKSLLDGFDNQDSDNANVIVGGVTKNVRDYKSRFPERNYNFFSNAAKDTSDLVKGLAQIGGNALNFVVGRPLMDAVLGDKNVPLYKRVFSGKGIEDIKNAAKNTPEIFNSLKEGLKENYGQGGIDLINEKGLHVDFPGLAQSFYAHPLNLLDIVGLGEVGKIKPITKAIKGGEASKFSKTIGNNTINPKYSENLAINAAQRIAETKPVQSVINAIDNSPLRNTTDVVADFLGLSPESRLLGTKGAEVRQAKLIEQANQTKNIAERNAAIAENVKNLSGITDEEAKNLVQSIESGGGKAYENLPLNTIVETPKTTKEIKDIIENLKYEKNDLNNYKINGRYKNNYYSRIFDNLGYDLELANRDFNTQILNDIKKNAKNIDDNYIAKIEQKTQDLLKNLPDEATQDYFDRMYKAIDEVTNTNKEVVPNNIPDIKPITDEKVIKAKDYFKNKVKQNADFYVNNGLLDEETVKNLPINTYASIKYNKPIIELTNKEKLNALDEINKLPETDKPFYVPMMYDDKLRAGDFFANTTKRYKPNELKQRKVGMGLSENKTGGKRVYDPVELANRLDAHRIKMVNTENMINEIIDNFGKPLNLAKEQVLDGYVPFNPDAFMKFYKKSIDLNETTLRKIQELDNIDTALKSSVAEAIQQLPDDVVELLGAVKNNKIYQIPKDVAETLMKGKDAKGIWGMMFDMGTAGFKRKVLGLSPKWFINNRIGNGIMAALKGVAPDNYIKALNISDDLLPEALRTKSMYEAEKTIIGRTGGGNNSAFGNTMRLLGGEFIDTSELKGFKKLGVNAANTLAIPGNVINKITDSMFKFNQFFENLERKGVYLHNVNTIGKKMLKTTGQNIVKQDELLKATLDNPEVLNEVMKNVDNTLGDYINMTSTERRAIRKIVPFYSWFRTITRYTLSLAETNPIRADLANKVSMIMAEENENLPEYQRGSIPTEYLSTIEYKPLILNYEHSIPFSTFGETADNPVGLLNPIITQTLEATRGKREFMDRPFVSRNYENVYNGGYASLNPDTLGEYQQELPLSERLSALPVGLLRTSIPGLEWAERVGSGLIDNSLNRGLFKPYDALFDTSFGGYNYDEGFRSKPKGWSNEEQLLRMLLPLQKEGEARGKVKTKRDKYTR